MRLNRFCFRIKKRILDIYNFLTHEQEIFYFAASLSFYTIFAVIPFLFIIFSVISNLPSFQNMMKDLKEVIISNIMPTNVDILMQMLDTFINQASKMGMIGFVYIGITSLLFFRNYEFITSRMFNSKPRKFLDSLMTYWMMITFFPVMIALMFYLNIEIKAIIVNYKFNFDFFFTNLLPLILTSLLFMTLFQVSANKTLIKKILIGSSFICACFWHCFKWVFFYYISYNKTYPSFYGSISILLIFMLWIYMSWTILLFGMRFCEGISIFAKSKKAPSLSGA